MQIAIKGLTNNYAQYMQDKINAELSKMGFQAFKDSFRKSDNAKLQESIANPREEGVKVINWEAFLDYSYYYGHLSTSAVTQDRISEIGKQNTINTPFGEMNIAIKIDDRTSVYLEQLSQLSAFDTNNDGFLNSSDLGAKNLLLVGYDKNGDEVELSLLDVLGGVELTQFFDYPKNGMQDSFASLLRPEESHSQIKKENILEFFKAFANKEGWIDFTDPDTAERIFSNNELDLSYRKKNADGSYRLQRINFPSYPIQDLRDMQAKGEKAFAWEYHAAKTLRNAGKDYVFNSKDVGALERLKNGSISYEYDSALRRHNGYHPNSSYDYEIGRLSGFIDAIENTNMHNGSDKANDLAKSFYQITGMNYSEANLARAKEGLASGSSEFLETLNTEYYDRYTMSDFVIGMQLNDLSGNITMLFSSGKEVTIAIEDLYSGNGELNVDEYGNRASVMNSAREMTQEELNELDFAQVGIKDESGTIVSLKDLGITAIQKATYADGRFLSFILTNSEGMQWNAQDLYNISFLTSGGLDKNHQQENNQESNSAFSNHTDKDSDSLTNKIRQISNPLVFPNKPQVDMRV